MPQVSKIKKMPKKDREWLEVWLKDNQFSNLDTLVEKLADRGYEISHSSVGRFSKEFKKQCENIKRSTEMAVFLSEQMGDDGNTLGDAAVNTMQAELFDAMQEYDWSKIREMDPNELSLSISRLSRAGVNQKKWMTDVKTRVKEAADNIEKIAVGAGASDESIALFRKEILGILE